MRGDILSRTALGLRVEGGELVEVVEELESVEECVREVV
jgi:hypothetical protein